MNKRGKWRVTSVGAARAVGARFASRPRPLSPRPSAGLTLVELMVTMAIISILAATLLGVAAVAGDTARAARTRNLVSRLHTLLLEYHDTFKTRRVRLDPQFESDIAALSAPGQVKNQLLAESRLYALREMMLMEMPDRWSDVTLNPLGGVILGDPVFLENRTALSRIYARTFQRLLTTTNSLTGNTNELEDIEANQSAECLYLVITLATADGEARSLFNENVIGDVDGDGAPEFLDGWGRPIRFLRWAPGFISDLQLNGPELAQMTAQDRNIAISGDHDSFDMYRRDPIAFRLVPLIYSAGPDEEEGIVDLPDYVTWPKQSRPTPSGGLVNPPFLVNVPTPYIINQAGFGNQFLGVDDGTDAATDNIHNHLLGRR